MKTLLASAALTSVIAMPVAAQNGPTTYDFEGSFDDATFAVRNAIVQEGLVVDFVSHVGDMLNRTREDVGGEKHFDAADIFIFCSAVVTREVLAEDPMNVAQCPYGIFVTEREGEVKIGYRDYPDGAMEKVEQLLDKIVNDAIEQ
ncbi:DUF302 domain-containing protein [Citreimonas salinaria]|uniref:DUF302 domain-containing protein n=1 Tax=Citreimonas salinaria TaxID=321339 RepID=UPI000B7C9784|nr:DUF302 domain-containing protein [Citreimonas salinaria]